MMQTLTWWRQGADPDVDRTLASLRADSLRFLIKSATAGYLGWHFVSLVYHTTASNSLTVILRHWALLLVVSGGLAVAWLLRRQERLASLALLTTAVVSVASAAWLLDAPQVLLSYSLIALAATVLWHPLGGLLTGTAAAALIALLRATGPLASISDELVLTTTLLSWLSVIVAWALGRMMVTAVAWSTQSYTEAVRNADEARRNRAELVQALKQLDQAYYRLQRANTMLELAWKAADDAERAKAEFVTNISHELRTPINLIIGFSELILNSPESYGAHLPAAFRGDLNAVYRSAQHILTLTNDVIDLARVGIGRLVLAREPVDLALVIGDACAMVQAYVEAKGLWLRVHVAPDLPIVAVDPLRVRQVLLNLLTNAARFTGRGGITVSAIRQDDQIMVSVRDTGGGITAEDLPRLFTEFYHGGAETMRLPGHLGGVGLGLPLSKRFVELHGGSMSAESSPGHGTTFWFTLPTTHAGGAATEVPPRRSHPPLPTPERQVLVLADTDRHLTAFFQRHLNGSTVISAPDLASAAVLADAHRAVAIVADLHGADLVADQTLSVPLIRLVLPRGERLAAELGAVTYLMKPVTLEHLQVTLAALPAPPHSVLIADDDPTFVRLLTRMLRALGPRGPAVVRTAHTGRQALARMAEQRPDLLLLDLVMPELDGAATLTTMRTDPRLAAVPVVIISAQDQITTRAPLPGRLSVYKPEGFRLEELLNTVEALLGTLGVPRRHLPAAAAPD